MQRRWMTMTLLAALVGPGLSQPASAHCDTMDGPVVQAARRALAEGDPRPALAWVKPAAETDVRAAFGETLAVRKLGPAAAALADRYFFETLVRLHRAGEGFAYDGLKPAGTAIEPAVLAADRALERNAVDELLNGLTAEVAHGVRERFQRAADAKRRAAESVDAGRAYADAYVEYVHYAEALAAAAAGHPEPAEGGHP